MCYAHDQSYKGDKFASRSRRCVFMEYPYGKKGWRLYDIDKEQFFVSRDIVFCETEFPYAIVHAEETEEAADMLQSLTTLYYEEDDAIRVGLLLKDQFLVDRYQAHRLLPPVVASDPVVWLGRGHRQKTRSAKLKNFVVNTGSKTTSAADASSSNYPVANYVDCERFSPQHQAFLAAITSGVVPKSFKQASANERWNNAMSIDIEGHERNRSFTIEDLPQGKKAIG
ncbi:PREDICTED: uncharacterized protein LOC104748489 [Camelina sativa]|uniref:Uncharacterized protein LOC104748489 n=1 Tax=Camelina sativa TaxID=90675 RepID=A0ABM1QZU1_CAMSA|nr:PREDICTED: uncharacterized protein LOC104748489 [Camelina sativa]